MLKQRRITPSLVSDGNRRSFFVVKGGRSIKLTPSTCSSDYLCTSGLFIRVYDVLSCRVTTFTFSSVAVYLITVVCYACHVFRILLLCVVVCAPNVRLRVPSVSGRSVGVEAGCLH